MADTPARAKGALDIRADGIRQSVPWKLRSDELEEELIADELAKLMDRGSRSFDQSGKVALREPFTEEEIETLPARVAARLAKLDIVDALAVEAIESLSAKFEFSVEAVTSLSKNLARALNTSITPLFTGLPRQKAIERAQKRMLHTTNDIMAASEALLRGFGRLEPLDTAQANDRIGAARFKALQKDYDQVLREVETLHRKLRILIETPDAALDLRPEDKRKVSDLRRTTVLFCLFAFWEREGRALSVTTNPIDHSRQGNLIEFVNTTVRYITDPSDELSSETIHDDLKTYKRANRGA